MTGKDTKGVGDLTDLGIVISLEIENIPESEFNDVMRISIGVPNEMERLYSLSIQDQRGLANRRFFEEIKNPNIVELAIIGSGLNNIEGLNALRSQLIKLNVRGNSLSIDQLKEITSLYRNNPNVVNVRVDGNIGLQQAIDDLRNTPISDETYYYLVELFRKSGAISYDPFSFFSYLIIPETDINGRKNAMLSVLSTEYMQNVPYYIEDARIFREKLSFTHNPMMIKDVTTFQNYLNDPSNYFEQSFLRDGTLLLTQEQLNVLISSGKTIPQNINLVINNVSELSNTELMRLKRSCDSLGLNFSGVRVFDQRKIKINPSDPDEKRVLDASWTHLADYTIDEYGKIRERIGKNC